jgi:hypothetical protein
VAAEQQSIVISGDKGQGIRTRRRNHLGNQLRGELREITPPAFLPPADERPRMRLVEKCCTRGCEAETSS